MATVVQGKFGTSNQALTLTCTGITNNSSQQSTAVDNSSNLFLDVLVTVKVKAASSSTSATGAVNVYAYGTSDGGTTYTGGVTGSNGSYTQVVPSQLVLIGQINVVANSATYVGGPFSVAQAFGGILPEKWGIVIENLSGATLDASVGSAWYQGYNQQLV